MSLRAFTNVFAGNPLDRASDRRGDAAFLEAALNDPESLALALWNGRPLLEASPEGKPRIAYLAARRARELAAAFGEAEERLLFLGLWKTTAVFALDLDGEADPADGPLAGLGRFEDLRASAAQLDGGEAAMISGAKAMFEWRRRHPHCPACGAATTVAEAGWKRICPACGAEHFPRTDPVVIMLPVKGERCLVGRQAVWPPKMYSALAGFLEPGESIEEACARELKEEAGLTTVRVHYHSTQPWPYPSSLMIGLVAEVASEDAVADGVELEEVRWLSREEAKAVIAGSHAETKAPGALAIAHQLLKAWSEGWPD
ncbi:MAG: NAD(+) diphosphatase [Alphaproteobacteria bacterium]|nr:NAD(+) diphosphatase [Alphaproteobacteria bacterium]